MTIILILAVIWALVTGIYIIYLRHEPPFTFDDDDMIEIDENFSFTDPEAIKKLAKDLREKEKK